MNSEKLSEQIGYTFQNPELLRNALTHSSYTNEKGHSGFKDNERLEFLGDAVFDAVISEYLYEKLEDVEEGKLTKLRALIVCERSLADRAERFRIGDYLYLGKGEEHTGGRKRVSIIADATEALIGAVFLDGGWDSAKDMVLRNFMPVIEDALAGKLSRDYKTELQEMYQQRGSMEIRYATVREDGPDHCKIFTIGLWMNGEKVSEGSGRTKKEAEQNAAKAALKRE
ncbi:MAG: ribonuclease III [Anaerovoracaceae bacterium]|nr:ribonuclease III [Anaerovoracaceae bacterium]